MWALIALFFALFATAASAQTFPKLTGRVVDEAKLLTPEQVAALSTRLQDFETQTGRQIVVATVPSLQGYPIEDYGYQLGRSWGIGQKTVNDGALVIVAPAERKMRIEVGYGLEPYLTDALSSLIVREQMRPRFKAGDYYGGIDAALDAMFEQLKLPPDQAEARQRELLAKDRAAQRRNSGSDVPVGIIFWVIVAAFVFLSMRRGRQAKGPWGARRYDRDSNWPVWLWVASEVADAAMRGGRGSGGSGWGDGGSWGGGGGGGGFSGGGGSFGGGGASGDW